MSILYAFTCQISRNNNNNTSWYTLNVSKHIDGLPLNSWEHVRYVIESNTCYTSHKLALKGYYSKGLSYIEGVHYTTWITDKYKYIPDHRLKGTDAIYEGDRIVLYRRPLPNSLKIFIPDRFDLILKAYIEKEQQDIEKKIHEITSSITVVEDEEECLRRLSMQSSILIQTNKGSNSILSHRRARFWKHASEYNYNQNKTPQPPPSYICKGCDESGKHFRMDCPLSSYNLNSGSDDDGLMSNKALDRVTLPIGIPKSFLKKVENSSNRGNAMRTKDGEFVSDTRIDISKQKTKNLLLATVETEEQEKENKDDNIPAYEYSHDNLTFNFEPFLTKQDKIKDKEMDKMYTQHPELRRKLNSMCTHWLRGLCQKGDILCEYLHMFSVSYMPICKFYVRGECAADDECEFKHELPPSKRAPSCTQYATGFCPRGKMCTYTHIKRTYPCNDDFENNDDFNKIKKDLLEWIFNEKYSSSNNCKKRKYKL